MIIFLRFKQTFAYSAGAQSGGTVFKLRGFSAFFGLVLMALVAFPVVVAAQATSETLPAKKAGVKRLCVYAGGPQGEAVSSDLMTLFQGDPSILEAVAITNRVETFRQAEIQKKECDLLLDSSFTQIPAKSGGFLSKAAEVGKAVNNETGIGNSSASRIYTTNRQADAADHITRVLTPNPKDKVKVGYKLISMSSKQSLLSQEKEVTANDLKTFLEKFANDVVMQSLK
jgi:hypothetical protein